MEYHSSQIVSLGGGKYAIPRKNLKELVRIPGADVKQKIDNVGSLPVVRLRQEFLPLIDLADVLGIEKSYVTSDDQVKEDKRKQIADRRSIQHLNTGNNAPPKDKEDFIARQEQDRRTSSSSAVNIAIVYSDAYEYGLVVDKFHDSEEIPIFPAGRYLAPSKIYLGTTTLKSEEAALVMDIDNVAFAADLSRISETVRDAVSHDVTSETQTDFESFSLLSFRNADTEHFAVALESVERLERFNSSDFEKAGTKEVVQYRGGVLPVFELSQVVRCAELNHAAPQEVIVFKHGDTFAGLKVQPPIDTIEWRGKIDESTFNTPPVRGSMILNDKTALLLDAQALVKVLQGSDARLPHPKRSNF
jgi:two-component system chemotaxis sensor kinase CheA